MPAPLYNKVFFYAGEKYSSMKYSLSFNPISVNFSLMDDCCFPVLNKLRIAGELVSNLSCTCPAVIGGFPFSGTSITMYLFFISLLSLIIKFLKSRLESSYLIQSLCAWINRSIPTHKTDFKYP